MFDIACMKRYHPYDVYDVYDPNAPGGWRPRHATGHFTLYDGFTNIDGIHHDYWAQSKHIYFWKLPYD